MVRILFVHSQTCWQVTGQECKTMRLMLVSAPQNIVKESSVNAETKAAQHAYEPDGPGREALDTLYRFVAALELTPSVSVHSIDRDGMVRFWNHSCEDAFGISAREAIG